jgi:hypothetical protein
MQFDDSNPFALLPRQGRPKWAQTLGVSGLSGIVTDFRRLQLIAPCSGCPFCSY